MRSIRESLMQMHVGRQAGRQAANIRGAPNKRVFVDQRYPCELITEAQLYEEYANRLNEGDELENVTFFSISK